MPVEPMEAEGTSQYSSPIVYGPQLRRIGRELTGQHGSTKDGCTLEAALDSDRRPKWVAIRRAVDNGEILPFIAPFASIAIP